MNNNPDICRVFVYGTLRSDAQFWGRPAVTHVVTECTTQGRIYDHGYPVAKLGEPGIIHGEIQDYIVGHPMFEHMCEVERTAGYVEEEITVITPDGEVEVMAWHYRPKPVGPRIVHGDFVKHLDEVEARREELRRTEVQDNVMDALDKALEEGLDPAGMAPQDIAADLLENDDSVRNYTAAMMIPHIRVWQASL